MQKNNLPPSTTCKATNQNFNAIPPEKQEEIINSLDIFSEILIKLVMSEIMHNIDNQHFNNNF